MRLTPTTAYLGMLLSLALLACQHPDQSQRPSPYSSSSMGRVGSYLFTGNPGIRTSSWDDISGTLTGTIGGQPIAFGPDQDSPLQATQGFDFYSRNPSYLSVRAQNDQYHVSLSFNGPFEAGRSYRIYNPATDNGAGRMSSYIVTAYIRPPVSVMTREIIDLARPDKQVRITALTDDYIDIEFLFTLDKPGAVQERINIRVKNLTNQNRNLRTQSEGEPYWNYASVYRLVEFWDFYAKGTPVPYGYPTPPTTTRVRLDQRPLNPSVTDITYDGKTESATGQSISLYQRKRAQEQTYIEYSFGTSWSTTGSKRVEIVWPNFTGVGTYTGDQVDISFYRDAPGSSWSVRPARLAGQNTQWQVDVQRVTPDFIEGTYTIVDAPLNSKWGSAPTPNSVSASGRFKVIYPR